MNHTLSHLATEAGLANPEREPLRLAFGLACATRVEHLVEEPRALACLAVLRDVVAGQSNAAALRAATKEIAAIANHHRGSNSIDGSAHAAVSATYALANALAGHALEAASYAAYAAVYAYGGYAVNDPSAFEPEFAWQVEQFQALASLPAHRPAMQPAQGFGRIIMVRDVYRYFATLSNSKVVLWCYLIWYFVTVANYFDPSPALWLNSLGISAVVGVALMLSVGAGTAGAAGAADRWQTFRLFLMPFCVSSFSSLIKGRGYFLVVPPQLAEQLVSVGLCAVFVLLVMVLRRFNRTDRA